MTTKSQPKAGRLPAPAPINVEEDALVVQASNSQLKSVSTLATRLSDLLDLEAQQEAALKTTKEQIRALQEQELPEAMDSCNMKEFTLRDGSKVLVESICAGSIPKKNEPQAFEWLRAHGHGGLIKKTISVALARGQDQIGEKVVSELKKLGVEVTVKDAVHASTLGAWAREMLAHGNEFPEDILGIYTARRAKVVEPKK